MRLPIIILVVLTCSSVLTTQDTHQPPCRNSVTDAFRLFQEAWRVVSRTRSGMGWTTTDAESRFVVKLDGCFLEEHWQGPMNGNQMETTVIIAYDTKREKCDLVSIDTEHGNMNRMEGVYLDSAFVFPHTEVRKGSLLIDRITMRLITATEISWKQETSPDGGSTWRPIWDMDYKKKVTSFTQESIVRSLPAFSGSG